jgi:CO/xanthine dehydrogenase Mo-binding subunit
MGVAPMVVNAISPAVGRRFCCLPICPEMLI